MKTVDKLVESLKPRPKKDQLVGYRVTSENKKLLKQVADNKGITLQELMTDALLMYLKSELKKEQEKS